VRDVGCSSRGERRLRTRHATAASASTRAIAPAAAAIAPMTHVSRPPPFSAFAVLPKESSDLTAEVSEIVLLEKVRPADVVESMADVDVDIDVDCDCVEIVRPVVKSTVTAFLEVVIAGAVVGTRSPFVVMAAEEPIPLEQVQIKSREQLQSKPLPLHRSPGLAIL
jgi:hypothetical protein